MRNGIRINGWLDRTAAAEHIGLTTYWLEKHAATDKGPRYIQHGRKVWYRLDDLNEWLNDQRNLHAGAGGTDALESLWQMGQKRRSPKPHAPTLEAEYAAEHGKPLVEVAKDRKRKWAELVNTFTAKQQKLLAEYRAG